MIFKEWYRGKGEKSRSNEVRYQGLEKRENSISYLGSEDVSKTKEGSFYLSNFNECWDFQSTL